MTRLRNYRSLVVLMLAPALIASCDDAKPLKVENSPSQEVIISNHYTSKWGYIQGSRNGYLVYGRSPLGEKAGEGISPTHRFRFRIKLFMQKCPELMNAKVEKAIQSQEKDWKEDAQ